MAAEKAQFEHLRYSLPTVTVRRRVFARDLDLKPKKKNDKNRCSFFANAKLIVKE